jgi:hypothetical protein
MTDKFISEWTLLQDIARYGTSERKKQFWPVKIVIHGTREQAQNMATSLSFEEAGCTDYWYIVEPEPEEPEDVS